MLTLIALCCFAFLAGFVDAMVGGGGLIQLPALFVLMPQLSLVQTLATNKMANFLGTTVAATQYIRKVSVHWRSLSPVIIAAFTASVTGALLVSYVSKEQFMPVIIVVLLSVLVYTIAKKNVGLHHQQVQRTPVKQYMVGGAIGAVIGFYDGLIGPGTGSFLIFSFIMLYGYNFLHASANAKIINWFTNIAALLLFFSKSAILWEVALPVGVANMVGSYIGSHVALKKGSRFLRLFFIAVVLVLILRLSWDYL